jgi:methylglutaconyl-CoA hydratase
MEGKINSEVQNGIETITFFHPQSNSLPGALLTALAAAIDKAGRNRDVRVIVLRSEGEKVFCAGASFDELISISTIEEGVKFFSGFANVINNMRKAPKFIIVRVQGKAVGGGVGLAAAADYALASEASAVKLSELAVGIGPFVVGPAVERKIGTAAFTQLSINASEWKSPEWAREKGLYADIYSSVAELDEAVGRLAVTLAASNPAAIEELKRIFWNNTDHWDHLLTERAALSGRLVLSDFTRQAIAQFKEAAKTR